MRDFFPLSAKVCDVKSLVLSIVIYIALSVVVGFICSLFTWIPLISVIIDFASRLFDLYCLGGILVSIMIFAKVI